MNFTRHSVHDFERKKDHYNQEKEEDFSSLVRFPVVSIIHSKSDKEGKRSRKPLIPGIFRLCFGLKIIFRMKFHSTGDNSPVVPLN